MTPKQIETLAGMIADNLPSLVRRRSHEGAHPYKLRNPEKLYVEPDDVKLIIRAALD
jgi:hypothetical protein